MDKYVNDLITAIDAIYAVELTEKERYIIMYRIIDKVYEDGHKDGKDNNFINN